LNLPEFVNRERTDNYIVNKKEQKDKHRSTKKYTENYDGAARTNLKARVNSGVPAGLAVPVSLVTLVVVLLNDTNII
jgi:hypothetical protein